MNAAGTHPEAPVPPQTIPRVVVLVKDTPAGAGPWAYGDDLTLQRERQPGTMSGVDIFAVAAACELGAEVIALTMGPERARGTLHEALSLGADRAVHVCDERLHGADARATAAVLARAVQRLGAKAVFAGRESSDGRMGVIGGMLAEALGWSLVSGADHLGSEGEALTGRVRERSTEVRFSAPLPAVCTVAEYGAEPRPIDEAALRHAFLTPIERWTLEDLGSPGDSVGIAGEPAAPRQRMTLLTAIEQHREHRIVRGADPTPLIEELQRAKEPAS